MKIGIDLDGTVFCTYEKMQERYRAQKRKEFNLELVLDFTLVRNLFDKIWLYHYFRSPESYRNLETYPDAIFSILKLKQFYEIYFITTRPALPKIREVTRASLKEYFEIHSSHIIFCKTFEDKVQTAENLGIQVLIEDNINPETIPPENGLRIILLKRCWNEKIQNSRVEIVDSWKEILKLL